MFLFSLLPGGIFLVGFFKFCMWLDAHPTIAHMNIFVLIGIVLLIWFAFICFVVYPLMRFFNKSDE